MPWRLAGKAFLLYNHAMKIFWQTLVAVLICVTPALAITIADGGKSSYTIVVAPDAPAPHQTAAKELQENLKTITGVDVAIAAQASGPAIYVGRSSRVSQLLPDQDWNALGADGIVIKTIGNDLILAGGEPRGTVYAVVTFLEDYAGVRWWTSTDTTIPHTPKLEIGKIDITYAPKFIYREPFYVDVNYNGIFSAHLRSDGISTNTPAEWGGHLKIIGMVHTFNQILPPDRYFKDHPDWYAMLDGKRQPNTQLCLTNQEMRKEMVRMCNVLMKNQPDAQIISISQNDCGGPCQCDKCQAIAKREGSESGPMIDLANYMAAELNKTHPGMIVDTLAYQYTRKPPKFLKPSKNVVVRLCPIEADFTKPLESPVNAAFGDDLRKWAAIAPNLFIWNYTTNFSNYLIPHPNLEPQPKDLRWFANNHVIGVFEEGDYHNAQAGDFLPLRAWLLGHLLWNPQQDERKLIDEFCNGYYGAAGPFMRSYVELIMAPARSPNIHMGCYGNHADYLSDAQLAVANKLFDSAARAVADDKDLSRRIRRERLAVDHLNLIRYDFSRVTKAQKANPKATPEELCADYDSKAKQFIASARELGVRNLGEGQSFDSYAPNLLTRAQQYVGPKLPAYGKPLPPGMFDIQENQFTLYKPGELSSLGADPKASNKKAARMPGSHGEWAIQFHVPKELTGAGPWKCYIVARVDPNQKAGPAFTCGLYSVNHEVARNNIDLGQAGDGLYHSYGIFVNDLQPGDYFWINPPGGSSVKAVYVDRIVMMKATK